MPAAEPHSEGYGSTSGGLHHFPTIPIRLPLALSRQLYTNTPLSTLYIVTPLSRIRPSRCALEAMRELYLVMNERDEYTKSVWVDA